MCTAFVLGIYLIYLRGYLYYIVTRVFKALWKIKNSKLWRRGLFGDGEGVELVGVGWKNIEPTWNNNLRFDRRRAFSLKIVSGIYTYIHVRTYQWRVFVHFIFNPQLYVYLYNIKTYILLLYNAVVTILTTTIGMYRSPRPERDTRGRRLIIFIIEQDLYVYDYFYFHAFEAIYLLTPA